VCERHIREATLVKKGGWRLHEHLMISVHPPQMTFKGGEELSHQDVWERRALDRSKSPCKVPVATEDSVTGASRDEDV
jgi:hypothetical protein